MRKITTYYADHDPMFDELVAQIPKETMRHHNILIEIGDRIDEILKRKGWSQTEFAKAMGKRDSEISKWLGGGHNFTIATITKIEAVLGEDIISVKKYRKPVSGYAMMPEERRRLLNDEARPKYGKRKKSKNED